MYTRSAKHLPLSSLVMDQPYTCLGLFFSQMSDGEARALFETHDAHIKSLRWLSLSPLLTNLDTIRKEYQPDGTVIERSTRAWARSIKTMDGKESAQCDVVNGGSDQLA